MRGRKREKGEERVRLGWRKGKGREKGKGKGTVDCTAEQLETSCDGGGWIMEQCR